MTPSLGAFCYALAASVAAASGGWRLLDDFEGMSRSWVAESGPAESVRRTRESAYSGGWGLAITLSTQAEGRMVRATWQTDVSDISLSPESCVRFWLKGSPLAQGPHGGLILVEAGGRKGGGDSHWILPIDGATYADAEWHLVTLGPVSEAANPDWAPDANGKLDLEAVVKLLLVAQQDTPGVVNRPFTVFMDQVEVSHAMDRPSRAWEATIEEHPDHVTPIWRGFAGRPREHPATVVFRDVTGWRALAWGGDEVHMARSTEEPCYEDLAHQARGTYRCGGGGGRYELVPPKPIAIAGEFDAVCAWVYGNNWSWVPDPGTPPVTIWVRVADATGQKHRINLGVVNFRFYGLLQKTLRGDACNDPDHLFLGGASDGRIHFPAQVEALEIQGGTNPEPRTIYIESVAFYRDRMELPEFHPERIADLPFPTTPDTILPTLERPTTVSLTEDGGAWTFRLRGDEAIAFRYAPRTGTLSDLTAQVGGGPEFVPCAGGGPAFVLGGREREPGEEGVSAHLLRLVGDGEALLAEWRYEVAGDAGRFALRLHAKGKSLIVDWSSGDPRATALRLGRVEGIRSAQALRVPYLCIYSAGPGVLVADRFFLTNLLDWYNTNCSALYTGCGVDDAGRATINGGALYQPLTDGARNTLRERQFISLSSRFEEVLPTVPNPPSTQREVTRANLYCHLGGTAPDRFDGWLDMWRSYNRRGIERVLVSHHEDAWSNGADVGQGGQEYTMCIEAAPEVGDAKLIAYCHAMCQMGYHIGLYENFTDYNPLGKSWDERNAARSSFGELMRVWPPTYAIRPLKALDMALDYPRRVAAKFGCNTAYRDCHTAYPPWGQVDFQAGSPGAGKLETNFRAWGALLLDGHRAYSGPIFSEGTHHWFSAGLVDGNYAQMGLADAPDHPYLLDFDLRKIHPLEADISMTPGWSWGRGVYHCLADTIAYGHIGFQPFGDLPLAFRYYYLMQQLQSRYVMEPALDIRYHKDGRFYGVSDAIRNGACANRQVVVRYRNGLEVAVNGNPGARWAVTLEGHSYDLGPDSWAAVQGTEFEEFSTDEGGRRIGYVRSPDYVFADAGGALRDFGDIRTDGTVVLRLHGSRGQELVPLPGTTVVSVPAPEGTQADELDEAGDRLGPAAAEWKAGYLTLHPRDRVVSFGLRGSDR